MIIIVHLVPADLVEVVPRPSPAPAPGPGVVGPQVVAGEGGVEHLVDQVIKDIIWNSKGLVSKHKECCHSHFYCHGDTEHMSRLTPGLWPGPRPREDWTRYWDNTCEDNRRHLGPCDMLIIVIHDDSDDEQRWSNLIVSSVSFLSITHFMFTIHKCYESPQFGEWGGRGTGGHRPGKSGRARLRKTTCESENQKRRGVGEKCHFLLQAVRKFYGFLDSEDISNCSKLTGDEYLWINKNNICSEAGLVTLSRPAILRLRHKSYL